MTTLTAQDRSAQRKGERVVALVGAQARQAAEAPLRSCEQVSLVRVAAACDAVGEALLPLGGESAGVVVCIGEDALPGEEAAEFAKTIRESAPGARLVRVAADASQPRGAFDAIISTSPAAEELLRAVGAAGFPADRQADAEPTLGEPMQTTAPAASTPDPSADASASDAPDAPDASDAPAASSLSSALSPDALLDEGPVQAVLRGESPLDACMERIRAATGDDAAAFIAATVESAVAPADAWPVDRHGRRYGWLALQGAPAETALRCAAWLGAWLALDAQAAALREAAFVDELTGAWNRRYFNRFLAMALERARRLRHHVTLMIFDIDDFKTYNDRYGHAAGDTVLKQTVRLLKSEIRPSDRVCRVGGDEFAVIFDVPEGPRSPGSAPPDSIADIAQRFQRQICQHRFPELAELAPGTLTISGGLATFPWDASDADALVKRADELALESKRQGKNLLTFGPGAEQVCRLAGLDEEPDRGS